MGSVVSLFLTGLGPVFPSLMDGGLVQLPVPSLGDSVQVSVCYQPVLPYGLESMKPAQVLYAGPAPLETAGLFQVNFLLPSFAINQATGNSGVASLQAGVTVPGGTTGWVSQIALVAVAP